MLCRTDHDNLHAGLFYTAEGEQRFLHLASQDVLLNAWDLEGGIWVNAIIDPIQEMGFAEMCAIIWENYTTRFPRHFDYGVHWNGSTFDKDGVPQLADGAQGMSCASFVLSVFESVGVTLVDMTNWPTRKLEDLQMVSAFSFMGLPVQKRILGEIIGGALRVRPQEMFVACEMSRPLEPVAFEDLQLRANELDAGLAHFDGD